AEIQGIYQADIAGKSTNHAPAATADTYSVNEDTTLTIAAAGVLSNDTDSDSNPLTAVLITGPAHGGLTLNTNGSFSYTPTANYNGSDSFTYQASDGTDSSNQATVSITVVSVNDSPSFTKGADQSVLEDSGAQSVAGWASAISVGPSESGQVVNFIVSSNNSS